MIAFASLVWRFFTFFPPLVEMSLTLPTSFFIFILPPSGVRSE